MELSTAAFILASVALFALVGVISVLWNYIQYFRKIKQQQHLLQSQLEDLNLKIAMYENVMRAIINPEPMEISDDWH